MKLKNSILVAALMAIALPASAYLVTEDQTTTEYLINQNFSSVIADQVQLEKAASHDQEYKSGRRTHKPFWKVLYERYLDINADDGHLMQHDIDPSSSFFDY